MTVLEVIKRSTEFLQKKGVDSPRLQAELLLAHRLCLPRMQLYISFDRVLGPEELASVRELITRRGKREPLQQIVGCTSFCGFEISLNRHVLVPRPETELLAECGWRFLSTGEPGEPDSPEALDVGTGSGCLAVTLAAKCPAARIWATDISAEALELASQNAARHGVASRLEFLQSDLFSSLPEEKRFRLIVSNPPYIPTRDLASLQPEVRDFEPRHALDGGEDGLRFYRRLASQAARRLLPRGRVMLEFGDGQERAVSFLFQAENWIVEQILEDYTRRPRILIAKPNPDEKA